MNRKTSNTASASPRGMSSRGAATLLLLAVLPPVGVAVLWARRVFRPRGRAVLTALSVLWALGIATIILSANQRTQINLPQVVVSAPAAPPAAVTAAPYMETRTALSNMDELLYNYQLERVLARGGTEQDLLTEEERLTQASEENEAILDTTVYCVYQDPKFYHQGMVCGNQTNGRALSLRDAIAEGLKPCSDCNPARPLY